MSPKVSKLLHLSLSLVPAALVVHSAAAADAVGDPQRHMAELLGGTRVAYAAPRNEKTETPNFDVQEYTRRTLLGFRSGAVEDELPSPAESNPTRHVDSPSPGPDVLASVQSFVSGKPGN